MAPRLKARIKADHRRNTLTLMNGLPFAKASWTEIPAGQEEKARAAYSDILEFKELTQDAPVEVPEEAPASVSSEELLIDPETEFIEETSTRRSRKKKNKKVDFNAEPSEETLE
jgi:hypothetical protein